MIHLYRHVSHANCHPEPKVLHTDGIIDITRAELVAKQRGGLPLQLRVEKDCQYDNHDNSHNVTCIYYK